MFLGLNVNMSGKTSIGIFSGNESFIGVDVLVVPYVYYGISSKQIQDQGQHQNSIQ